MKLYTLPYIRINNFKNAENKILQYWRQLYSLNISSQEYFAIYTNYLSNYTGDYDFTVGCEASFVNAEIINIDNRTIESYKIFKSKIHEIISIWQQIWLMEDQGLMQRSYLLDFEKHYANGDIEIYVGVK